MADDTHICGVCKTEFHNLEEFISHKKTCPSYHSRISVDECENTGRKLDSTVVQSGDHIVASTHVNQSEAFEKPADIGQGDILGGIKRTDIFCGEINDGKLLHRTDGPSSVPAEIKLVHLVPFVQSQEGTSNPSNQQQLVQMMLVSSQDKAGTSVQGIFLENPTGTNNNIQHLMKDNFQDRLGSQQIVFVDGTKTPHEMDSILKTTEGLGVVTLDEHHNTLQTEQILSKLVVTDQGNQQGYVTVEQPIDLSGTSPVDSTCLVSDVTPEQVTVLNQEEIYQLATSSVLETIDSIKHERIVVPQNALGDVEILPAANKTLQPLSPQIKALEKINLGVLSKRHACKRCSVTFAHKKDLNRHMRVHTGFKPFACNYCDKRFGRTDKRKIHERSHTGERPYKCTTCPYASTDRTNLKKHILIHTNEKPYRCQICEYACRNSNQLNVHIRTHTGDSPYSCYICAYTFKIKSDLTRHMRIHTGEKPYQCRFCDYRCTIKSNLKSHERTNHDFSNMLSCEYCEYKTSSRKNFTIHMSSVHNYTATQLKCTECDFATKDKQLLKTHMKKVHKLASYYSCGLCSFTAERRALVNGHIRVKHPHNLLEKPRWHRQTGKRPLILKEKIRKVKNSPALCQTKFKCSKCDAAFARENSLGCHMRNHNDTEKIMAMAVLDLQRPFVSRTDPGTSAGVMTSTSDSGLVQLDTMATGSQQMDQPSNMTTINVDVIMKPTGECNHSSIENPCQDHMSQHLTMLGKVCHAATDALTMSASSPDEENPVNNDGSRCVTPKRSSSASKVPSTPSSPQFSTAFLNQAASNLIAFMQNNQNRAVEDNMNNMARDIALNSALSVTNGPATSQTHGALSQNSGIVSPVSSTSQHIPQVVMTTSNLEQTSNNQDLLTTTVLSSGILPHVGTHNIMLNSESTTSEINASNIHIPQSQMLQSNLARSSNGQSNWEQLQEAVLQHSVNLQSSESTDSQLQQTEFDRDNPTEIQSGDLSVPPVENTSSMMAGNLSELEQSRSDFIVMI